MQEKSFKPFDILINEDDENNEDVANEDEKSYLFTLDNVNKLLHGFYESIRIWEVICNSLLLSS